MTKNLIMLILLLNSCNSNRSNDAKNNSVKTQVSDSRDQYYKDINLFRLEGIGKIEGRPSCPYIAIERVNDLAINIVYQISEKESWRVGYDKHNNYWQSLYITKGDTSVERVYEYVFPDKIITLNYLGEDSSKGFYLRSVVVLQNWKEISYRFSNEIVLKPGIDVPDIISQKAVGRYIKEIGNNNGILSFYEKEIDNNGRVLSNQKECYDVGNHSYFWWSYFYHQWKKIDCK